LHLTLRNWLSLPSRHTPPVPCVMARKDATFVDRDSLSSTYSASFTAPRRSSIEFLLRRLPINYLADVGSPTSYLAIYTEEPLSKQKQAPPPAPSLSCSVPTSVLILFVRPAPAPPHHIRPQLWSGDRAAPVALWIALRCTLVYHLLKRSGRPQPSPTSLQRRLVAERLCFSS
jgi:hypothetical protein